jgi:two-component system cell cycle sensor histidine kinase/response regulator CckA
VGLLQSSGRIASGCWVVCDSTVLPHPAHHIHPLIGLDRSTLPHLAHPCATGTSGQSANGNSYAIDLTKLRIEDDIALETVFRRVTETAADVLNVERVGVWLLVDERQALRCVDLFERSKATHSAGITVQVCAFPEYFAALERRKTVPAEVALTDPRTSELADAYLTPLGITSMLDATIFGGGEVVGVVCHEHIGAPREWTTEQRDFAGSMADVLALKSQAAEMAELRVALRTQAMQLAESRRVGSLAEMAAGVAHDFNNILTVMIGGAELIAENPACPAEVAAIAQRITAAGRVPLACG